MKLRQVQKTKIERMLDEIEYFGENMEQQEYITFDLEKDLRRLSAMLDDVREEIEKKWVYYGILWAEYLFYQVLALYLVMNQMPK